MTIILNCSFLVETVTGTVLSASHVLFSFNLIAVCCKCWCCLHFNFKDVEFEAPGGQLNWTKITLVVNLKWNVKVTALTFFFSFLF